MGDPDGGLCALGKSFPPLGLSLPTCKISRCARLAFSGLLGVGAGFTESWAVCSMRWAPSCLRICWSSGFAASSQENTVPGQP